jgi:SPP1 family holin
MRREYMKRKIETGTIARTMVLLVALLNQVLVLFDKTPLPFAEESVYNGASTLITVAITLISWWKNNSFSQAALEADEVLKERKKYIH